MMNPDAAAKPTGAPTRKVIPPPPSASLRPPPPPPDQPPLKCPRCDSPNTKFCYYNNYSLSQPRHFCKTCRRYWTKGGALRNVPVGGGCRKNKKSRPSSSSSTSSAAAASSSKSLQGLSMPPPTMDFPRGLLNQFISFGDLSGGGGGAASVFNGGPIGVHETSGGGGGSMSVTASIETLSSMNQDLHWKLQQQRLAMMFGGGGGGGMNHQHVENSAAPVVMTYPMAAERGRGEWVFEGGASSYGGGVGVGGSNGGVINSSNSSSSNNNNSNNWGSIQSWSDLHHFTALP